VIWTDAIVHHLIAELPLILSEITRCPKPEALMIFSEPVNLNPTLRRVRLSLPVKLEGTPDERPLEIGELEVLRRFVTNLHVQHFTLLGRLDRFILKNYNYERSSWPRRTVSNLCAGFDALALSIPGIRTLVGYAVFYGYPIKG
jgi:hypothetical protein